MSRIIGMTLLLIILIDNLCHNTASSAQFRVTKLDIRKCRCTRISSGKLKCPQPLKPTDAKEKQDLKNCLCSNTKQQNRPELPPFCPVRGSATPL